jgi:hypothetical protein
MTPSQPTVKRLFAMSGNKCAFSDCRNPIWNEEGILIGEMCHIEARSPQGPRYNTKQTEEEREGFENLLLLCGIHHPVIDKDYESYTVAKLKKIKADHEQKYINGIWPTDEVFDKLFRAITNNDKTTTKINKEIYINMFKSEIELCISLLEDRPQLLPVDRWTSAVHSGSLKLFKNDESASLSRVYHKIKRYNDFITSQRLSVHTWGWLENEQGFRLPITIRNQVLRDKASLLDDLRKLKNEEWLNP